MNAPLKQGDASGGERLVYARDTGGHRQSYLDQLGALFGLESVSGPIDRVLFRRLVTAEELLIATLDDHVPAFVAVTAARSMRGRRTVALFLRAQKCFEAGRWYYPLKRRAFSLLKGLPGLTLVSITPFSVMPRHAEVAHVGICDPQYWDLHDGTNLRPPAGSPLRAEVLALAAGRHVVCALGTLGLNKGTAFLAETLRRHPGLADKVFVVAAGRVPPEAARAVSGMASAGALVIDRFVSDDELESLYGVADSVWACYAPDYDQASGIFGRAVQFGVRPVLRAGSVTETFARVHNVEHMAVSYGDHEALAALLASGVKRSQSAIDAERAGMIGGWRREFVQAIGRGLRSARPIAAESRR